MTPIRRRTISEPVPPRDQPSLCSCASVPDKNADEAHSSSLHCMKYHLHFELPSCLLLIAHYLLRAQVGPEDVVVDVACTQAYRAHVNIYALCKQVQSLCKCKDCPKFCTSNMHGLRMRTPRRVHNSRPTTANRTAEKLCLLPAMHMHCSRCYSCCEH
jgi:hypothetical protein